MHTLNHHPPPPYPLQHVGNSTVIDPQQQTTDFQCAQEVEAFMNRAVADSRYYDLEPIPGELGPWTQPSVEPIIPASHQASFNAWNHQVVPLTTNPFTMNSQPNPNAPRGGGYYETYYPTSSSSTESTPPNGFVPYYIDTTHPTLTSLQQPPHAGNPISPYPSTFTPHSPQDHHLHGPYPLDDPEAEQKRLRNTAASARFRAKKKKREASLERASAERRALVGKLEGRVKELEEENKWLKELVWEKRERGRDGKGNDVDDEGDEGVEEDMGKREGDRNDGVGTQ